MSDLLQTEIRDKPVRAVTHTESGKPVFHRAIQLPSEDSGLDKSIVRLFNAHIGKKKHQYVRRIPVVITNRNNGHWILRYAMGSNAIKGLTATTLGLDYDGVNDLGIKFKQECDLIVEEATLYQQVHWLWFFPCVNVRLSFRLGLLGFVFGLIGLVTGVGAFL
ncbi:hypothetical protein [Vibrio owensii]|uniref:hypothetical protein n=1 Tax=Vibrio owensii TaxID=696485 RepID=UPI004067D418